MEAGRVLAGRYELEREIGSGGAAVVWRARDRSLGRTVAVKLLHPARGSDDARIERFRREARSAAGLNHPNAVAIYDIGGDGDETFIVMEYVDGPGLGELLGRPLDASVVTAIGHQVAAALGAAHARGLVHRDVKPANILLASSGAAKVADFGIAKAMDGGHTTLTRTGTMVGTVAYLAPEQIRGGEVGPSADVYALGLVLHEALTGEPPFGTGTPAEVTARRLAADPPRADEIRPGVPSELTAAISRATRLDPTERFRDGTALADELEPMLVDDPEVLLRKVAAGSSHDSSHRDETRVLTAVPPPEDVETIAIDLRDRDATPVAASRPVPERDPAPVGPATVAPPPSTVTDGQEADANRAGPLPSGVRRPILALVSGLAIVLVAASLMTRGGGGDIGGGDDGGSANSPSTVEVTAAQDFDPFGDGEEHREDAPNAHDSDTGTVWTTERYDSADMGGLKPGVGLWFDLGSTRELTRIELTVSPGIAFEILVGDSVPEGTDPAAWGSRLAEVSDAEQVATVEVPDDVSGRYVLVWITSVGGGGQRAEIAEAHFIAR